MTNKAKQIPAYTAQEVAEKLAAMNRAYDEYGATAARTPSDALKLNELSNEFEALSQWFGDRAIMIAHTSGKGFRLK